MPINTSTPEGKAQYNAYMRTYMRLRRAGLVSPSHSYRSRKRTTLTINPVLTVNPSVNDNPNVNNNPSVNSLVKPSKMEDFLVNPHAPGIPPTAVKIMELTERKQRLSVIAREASMKFANPIHAIAELNRMEHIYDEKPILQQQIVFVVGKGYENGPMLDSVYGSAESRVKSGESRVRSLESEEEVIPSNVILREIA